MHQFQIKIANHIIEVNTIYIRSFAISRDFITDGTPEFRIEIEQRDIDAVRKQYEDQQGECCLGDTSLESLALQIKLSEKLIDQGVFLIHGAAIAFRDSTIIFSGRSGVGKTTHILKWIKHLPDTIVINGDKPYIDIKQAPIVFGSPWAGKENIYTNTAVSLKHIVFMQRSDNNLFERISFAKAFPFLLEQVYCPQDGNRMKKTLNLIQRLNTDVSFWIFHCNNFKEDCFDVSFNTLVEGYHIP